MQTLQTGAQLSPETRKRRRGVSRIYSGCGTCRSRKIKCDQRQPTCLNCERSRRYICDGYDQPDPFSDRYRRPGPVLRPPASVQAVPATSPRGVSRSSSDGAAAERDIEGLLQELDAAIFDPSLAAAEALGDRAPRPFPEWTAWVAAPPAPRREADRETGDGRLVSGRTATAFQNGLDLLEEYSPWPTGHYSHGSPAVAELEPQNPARSTSTGLVHSVLPPELPPPNTRTLQPVLHGRVTPLARELRPPEPVEISETTRKLLHHYRTHVCQLMMPTSAPSHNPWLRIYLPVALQEPETTARKCLLYAILSVAAFNKAELSASDRNPGRRQAILYKDTAADLLKRCLLEIQPQPPVEGGTRSIDATDNQALLAAALTMTTVEVFSGATEGKGYEHLQICKQIIRRTGGLSWWLSDTSSATLLQIFRCLEIVAHTSGWSFLQDSGPAGMGRDTDTEASTDTGPQESIPDEAADADRGTGPLASLAPQYTLDVTFGVSMKTLACMNKIVELSTIRAGLSEGEGWPESCVGDLIKLEAELFDALDDPDALGGCLGASDGGMQEGISSYVSEEIKRNHVYAFHHSSILFFRRALCDGGSVIKPPVPAPSEVAEMWSQRPSGQSLVSKALEYLENVDALSSEIAIANTLWPGFIASVEAVDMPLRHRALIWFARAKRHGIGNIGKAKELVMEVWRRVDRQTWVSPERKNLQSELSHTDWRQVMRETGMYIMLT